MFSTTVVDVHDFVGVNFAHQVAIENHILDDLRVVVPLVMVEVYKGIKEVASIFLVQVLEIVYHLAISIKALALEIDTSYINFVDIISPMAVSIKEVFVVRVRHV